MKLFSYENINIKVFDDVFYPTETSKMFIDFFKSEAKSYSNPNNSILDLGCGSGVVSVSLKALGFQNSIFASDISENAKLNVIANSKINNVDVVAKSGSLFEPWIGNKFDIIIDDISGVAKELAQVSEWFGDSISCESGEDGTALTRAFLSECKNYLNDDGVIFFPVLSLSNATRIIEHTKSIFESVEEVSRKVFYLPKELSDKNNELILKLNEKRHIQIEEKFGMYLWETVIYKASLIKGRK
ncbi:methyltransferase [Candidatus Pseudothioglobus sp. Uisw_050_01]|uniref:methyltransferase n=1 Tax=Candidatus Pseudothioglobus sp. Uisw_050_01 TaxID=3230997 RepID=UPI003A841205